VTLYIIPDGSTRIQMSFLADEVANMEKLLTALTKAGMKEG